jgi:hypothetical protein
MTWYAIIAVIGAFLLVFGFAMTRIEALSGDDYISEVAGYAFIIIAIVLEIVAGIGWVTS